jgi:hypothetical protein
MVAIDEALFGQTQLCEQLQRPVNGSQADARVIDSGALEDGMRIQVTVGLLQDLQDQLTLTRQPLAFRPQSILEFGGKFSHNAP